MLYYITENELPLKGEFHEAVLREFNHKNIAFEQLREMGLELTNCVGL